jgi:hypothetical protein
MPTWIGMAVRDYGTFLSEADKDRNKGPEQQANTDTNNSGNR